MNYTIPHPNGAGVMRATNGLAEGGEGFTSVLQVVPKIGLALSGGGARGLAHVGVLQVLEEENIPIAAVAGTSMGAYVGSLFAAGLDTAKLVDLAKEIHSRKALLRLMDPIFPPSAGLIRGDKIRRHLERSLGSVTFAELKRPLLVIATDLDTMQAHVFDHGSVAQAVHASAAIPGVCAPVLLDGRRYTDGGAADPLPVTTLRERFHLDAVIAINVLPTNDDILRSRDTSFSPSKKRPGLFARMTHPINLLAYGNVMDTFRRALMCAQVQLVEKEMRHAEIVIHPFHHGSTWFDFENYERYIETGRLAALAALPDIRSLLSNPNPMHHETLVQHSGVGRHAA